MRDALVAGATLNIFNSHADRIVMANIAQLVNVLQSVILTEGEKMLLTPTYHVFDLYSRHQDAELLDCWLTTPQVGCGEEEVPQVSVSASKGADGGVTVTLCNLSDDAACTVKCVPEGMNAANAQGRILTGAAAAYNTFEAPEAVRPAAFDGFTLRDGRCTVELPACSVLELVLR